jgi:hypothetical protein
MSDGMTTKSRITAFGEDVGGNKFRRIGGEESVAWMDFEKHGWERFACCDEIEYTSFCGHSVWSKVI